MSIQQTHVHVLVEAENSAALSRGMQGFQISAAKQINRAIGKERGGKRRGRVFADRYFAEMFVWFPRTWLLVEEWRRYGLIDAHEVPSQRTAVPSR